jgi:hypothetical protein
MKKLVLTILIIVSFFGLTACDGYNKIMREHLSNENNYITVNAKYSGYEDLDDSMVVLIEIDETFNGFDISESDTAEIRLQIIGENYSLLKDIFINEEIVTGTSIIVKCSTWIYMDTNFYYIAELKANEQTYLTFEDGLKNIIDYMDNNKSLF